MSSFPLTFIFLDMVKTTYQGRSIRYIIYLCLVILITYEYGTLWSLIEYLLQPIDIIKSSKMFLLQVARRFTKGLQDLVNQAAAEAEFGGDW